MKELSPKSMTELLAAAHPDRPQAIAAGWFTEQVEPIGAAFVHCKKHPTFGELAVAWACCLAGCLKRVDELVKDNPDAEDAIWNLVFATVGDLEIVKRMKNEFATVGKIGGAA